MSAVLVDVHGLPLRTGQVVPFKQRRYDAASRANRLSAWATPSTDANAAITHPALLRNRARDLVRNNPWAHKGLLTLVHNTVGYGIRPKLHPPGKRAAKLAQQYWQAWAETAACDATPCCSENVSSASKKTPDFVGVKITEYFA